MVGKERKKRGEYEKERGGPKIGGGGGDST